MNSRIHRRKFACPLFFLIIFSFAFIAQASSIEGFVYDMNRNALQEVDVELRDQDGRTRFREKTDGIGRYSFQNLPDGRYYIKVFAFRYNLQDAVEEVRVETLSILAGPLGSDTIRQDFYLKPKKGTLSDTTTGVVFAQDVPGEAKAFFKEGVSLIDKDKRQEGMEILVKAIEVHPTYYAALNKLGLSMLIFNKQYMQSASLFLRAVQVNPKSSKSYYYLGIAFSNLDKKFYKASAASFAKADELAPNSHLIQLELGKIHKKLGNFAVAEKSLIKAKKLSRDDLPEAHLLLAQLYSDELKQYGKAADELERYIKTSKDKDEKLKAKVDDLRAKARSQT